jgi:hypothetical protein
LSHTQSFLFLSCFLGSQPKFFCPSQPRILIFLSLSPYWLQFRCAHQVWPILPVLTLGSSLQPATWSCGWTPNIATTLLRCGVKYVKCIFRFQYFQMMMDLLGPNPIRSQGAPIISWFHYLGCKLTLKIFFS